jgi:hypothetical protein
VAASHTSPRASHAVARNGRSTATAGFACISGVPAAGLPKIISSVGTKFCPMAAAPFA